MPDSDANTIKCFKTRGGTLVEFDDNNGEEIITVKTPEQLCIVLREDPQIITISSASSKIELDGKSGKITLNAEKEISLKTGMTEISMKSDGRFFLKGNELKLAGGNKGKTESCGVLELNGSKTELSGTTVDIKASSIMAIKGSLTKIN